MGIMACGVFHFRGLLGEMAVSFADALGYTDFVINISCSISVRKGITLSKMLCVANVHLDDCEVLQNNV